MSEPIDASDPDGIFPDDLRDVADLLDIEFIAACKRRAIGAPSLQAVRRAMSSVPGSLSDRIIAEREDR